MIERDKWKNKSAGSPDVKKVKVDLYLQTGETLTLFPKLEETDVAKIYHIITIYLFTFVY